MLVFMVMMAEMIFSGYAFPVENMPRVLALASNLVPIKHWLLILRAVMLKGVGLDAILPQILALAALGVVIMTTTVLVLRRRLTTE